MKDLFSIYRVFSVIVDENEDSSKSDVGSNNHVSDKHESRNQRFIMFSWRLQHAVRISRIKPKRISKKIRKINIIRDLLRECCCRESISNKIHPQELH